MGSPDRGGKTTFAILRRIFDQIKKSEPANRKKDFHTKPSSQELGDRISFCIKRLETLNCFEKFKDKIKKLEKNLVVDDPTKTFAMVHGVPFSGRSNPAGRSL